MHDSDKNTSAGPAKSAATNNPAPRSNTPPATETDPVLWMVKLVVTPLLFLAAGVVLIVGLGVAQKMGWISSGGGGHQNAAAGGANVRYICPMMCTPPQSEPGRCPVCAMELVPATSGGGNSDMRSVQIDPAARRVANIQTAPVMAIPITHTIKTIGELTYDEGTLKTLSAYVDGRIEQLLADYTGAVVKKDDNLALIYSPRLYSSQVELLLAKKAFEDSQSSTLKRIVQSNRDIYKNARQRLVEEGMTEQQIDQLEQTGKASSRMHLRAPISGTIIEKPATEGQYVKEGQIIYKLADLSTVWLMLRLFPEDAATIRYGQKVEAEVQSLPGKTFVGRVAFIDPNVDRKTRTVGVRVVIPNENSLLRIGDYAKAIVNVQLANDGNQQEGVYDPELANKWISPRHPHIVKSEAGSCPICGIKLVPAAEFGFIDQPAMEGQALIVPRSAVLMAGDNSVVYVETNPGRFEIRKVVLGPSSGDKIVILSGVKLNEQVATRGNFLIDSQMQLAGNPSLIDPTRAIPLMDQAFTPEMIAALSKLSQEDKAVAEEQKICPVTKFMLGSMGTPLKVDVNGRPIFICCKACEDRLLNEPETYLVNLEQTPSGASDEESRNIAAALSKLSPQDLRLAKTQKICPVADLALGSMGTPSKVDVNGEPVFICCEACRESLLKNPKKYLTKLASAKSKSESGSNIPEMDLPPIEGLPQMEELELPEIEALPEIEPLEEESTQTKNTRKSATEDRR